ncbi:hypothetical protein LTR49_027418 [Elasticomyces elasticus]|nr:hypothetical protein LTR49_027418 [Elasticomyces elasticus]
MGPTSTSAEVFRTWENQNGWPSTATAVLIGIIAPITTLTSADSICHLAEELQDPPRHGRRGSDVQVAIDSTTGQPYIAILLNATESVIGTAILVGYIVLALLFCATNLVTTSSRQLFSFARDQGVPFWKYLSQVSEKSHVPVRAIAAEVSVTIGLSVMLTGSSLAFNIIASLGGLAILGSYLISVSALVYQRLCGSKLPQTDFSLGRYGLSINLATIVFDFFAFIMIFFPAGPNPTVETMNWACLIFMAVVAFALGCYFTQLKNVYRSPLESTCLEEDIEMSPARKEELP